MERARIRRDYQQFQAQFEVRSQELREVLAADERHGYNAQRALKLQYELGQLCAERNEFRLASVNFEQVLTRLNEMLSDDKVKKNDEAMLRINVLNWLAVMQFRAGNQSKAMNYLLQAKQCARDEAISMHSSSLPMDKSLTINYALFLHAKGNIEDAESAAQVVVNEGEAGPCAEHDDDIRAQSTAFMCTSSSSSTTRIVMLTTRVYMLLVLASICRARDEFQRAFSYAERAVALADRLVDPRLISRAHNNLGIYCLEQKDVERALTLLVSAFGATQQIKDFAQQATVKYHLGIALSYLSRNAAAKQIIVNDEEDDDNADEGHQRQMTAGGLTARRNETNAPFQAEATTKVSMSGKPPSAKTPKDLFRESETLTLALPAPDKTLHVLAQSCRGGEEYFAGEFHTAEAEFTIALSQLHEYMEIDTDEGQKLDDSKSAEEEEAVLLPIEPEIAKLQGLLLSYMGCTQLMEGKFALAIRSHKRDLALALGQEDLQAQHRALCNLAIAYNTTQEYKEAIPLWREALELAVVLDLKTQQLVAYSGLGSALRELQMLEGSDAIEAAGITSDSGPLRPLQVFRKQRALAEEVNDLHQRILAQRHIVSIYESPIFDEGEATEVLESRLTECDALVRLCAQYENLQYRAEAYRSLANALTSQIIRLRAQVNHDGIRASQDGLANAIEVLSHKRNCVFMSYQEVNAALSSRLLQDGNEERSDNKVKSGECNTRQLPTRIEILQRR